MNTKEELAIANHCWKECSERLDWLENALNVDMRFYEDEEVVLINKILDDYNEKFFSIKEEK